MQLFDLLSSYESHHLLLWAALGAVLGIAFEFLLTLTPFPIAHYLPGGASVAPMIVGAVVGGWLWWHFHPIEAAETAELGRLQRRARLGGPAAQDQLYAFLDARRARLRHAAPSDRRAAQALRRDLVGEYRALGDLLKQPAARDDPDLTDKITHDRSLLRAEIDFLDRS